MTAISTFPPDIRIKVLKLHHEVFSDSACKSCDGACCDGCARTRGYFYDNYQPGDDALHEARKEKYGWDDKLGFKGPTGCLIPVHERSAVCVSFACSGLKRQFPDGWGPLEDKPFVHFIRDPQRGLVRKNDDHPLWRLREAVEEGERVVYNGDGGKQA